MLNYRIKTFLELYEILNYRETAEKLNLTQPAVTQHIQALENEYGCKLFIYDHKKLHKTESADKLALYARSMLYNDKKLREDLKENKPKILRVGATKTIGEYVICEKVSNYLSNPSNTLSLTVDNTKNLLKKLENDEIDFALVEGNFDKNRYGYRTFLNEPFVGMCASDHPFSGKEIEINNIFDNTIILREEGSGTRSIFDYILTQSGYCEENFKRCVYISNFTMICNLVRQNKGISFAYKAVADSFSGISTFTIKNKPITHDFNFVFLKHTKADSLIDKFLK